MKICVYGAAGSEVPQSMILKTEQLGIALAERGHSLVFGGGNGGMMGAIARGVYKGGGEVIGIAPRFFDGDGVFFPNCKEFIHTNTMRERKALMEQMSDAFIVTPGGVGTFDEFFEILTLRSLGQHTKPIAVFNADGYYEPLRALFKNAVDGRFMKEAVTALCPFFSDPTALITHLETDEREFYTLDRIKEVQQGSSEQK